MTPKNKHEPLVVERTFNAPVALVWKAITNREDICRWSFEIKEFKPEVGFEFEFHGGKDGKNYLHRCRVVEVIQQKRLAYSWRYEGYAGDSLVTFELFAEGNKTRVKLTHTGLETFPPIADFAEENFVAGWTDIIGRLLKEYVEEANANTPSGQTTNSPAGPLVQVSRKFDAPAETIFAAWVDPKQIGQWMFGPAIRDEQVIHLETDLRPGGKFSFLVRRQGVEIDHVGTYLEIDRPRRLVFTWGIAGESEEESIVTIEIRALAEGCELTLKHQIPPAWADYASRTEAGWTKMLNGLAEKSPRH